MMIRNSERTFEPLNQIKPMTSERISTYLKTLKPVISSDEIRLQRMHDKPFIKIKRKRKPLLDGQPLAKGIVLRTLVKKPRKPNSGNRKCVLLKLSTGRESIAYVPGEGHNLQEHNAVLVKIARLRDTPFVRLKCIRGAYDLPHVIKKKQD